MTFDRSALIRGMACAYDSWLGKDQNGPERYLYNSALNSSFDTIRTSTFFDYWKLTRSMRRDNRKIFMDNCFSHIKKRNWKDRMPEFKEIVKSCTNYNDSNNAESAASKILFNFFPIAGYVIDTRTDEAIKHLLRLNNIKPIGSDRIDRFECFYNKNSVVDLRKEINSNLSFLIKSYLSKKNESYIFSGRIIDKYLFFIFANKRNEIDRSILSREELIDVCYADAISPSDEACDFTLTHWDTFSSLFDKKLALS